LGTPRRFTGRTTPLTKRARRLAGIRRGAVAMFELNLDGLAPLPSRENRYTALSEYPQADFDVSLIFSDSVSWRSIRDVARTAHDLLRDVVFVDEFRGRDVPPGHKSLTLRLRIGDPGKTLRAEEISEVAKAVTAALSSAFDVQQRSASQ
jgi:phenylalanyl-tRNA synthetase beta chain